MVFFKKHPALDKLYLLVAIDFILFPITSKELFIYFAVTITWVFHLNSLPWLKGLRDHYHFLHLFLQPPPFPIKWITYPVLARLSSTRPWKSEKINIKFSFYQMKYKEFHKPYKLSLKCLGQLSSHELKDWLPRRAPTTSYFE